MWYPRPHVFVLKCAATYNLWDGVCRRLGEWINTSDIIPTFFSKEYISYLFPNKWRLWDKLQLIGKLKMRIMFIRMQAIEECRIIHDDYWLILKYNYKKYFNNVHFEQIEIKSKVKNCSLGNLYYWYMNYFTFFPNKI